ncbi:dienelactone hydrolase family protein [Seohaeicola zhoushanensis]|uniref:Carboxymethylenebutenolidase n=1 Tax=Seohaeicola zhoushanensis TaxID=1569283 RepID=A0A8J3GV03_9RHOB|nr:dienelactone hydrolase family protein [Seohaeicola zhoushanensis]GHF41912.1 carboxymethylenebutenolidase [Seohaeicola zhoushanensis]
MGEQIRLKAADGFELGAWLARPEGLGKGAIVVVQEIFGVNAHIRELCDRFAAAGYAACAPALFDRTDPGFECGYTPEDIARARQVMNKGDISTYLLDVAAARDALTGYSPVSITGFCLGGSVAFAAAARLDGFLCSIPFYGGRIAAMKDEAPRCPMMMYFGTQDQSIPMSDVEAIRAARPESTIHVVEAGHGFMCDHRASYAPEVAAKAWNETIAMLDRLTGN